MESLKNKSFLKSLTKSIPFLNLHQTQVEQMNSYRQVLLSLIVVIAIAACKRPPDFPVVPEISYLSLTKTIGYKDLGPGSCSTCPDIITKIDSVVISIYFKDGDGDLGSSSGTENYFCKVLIKKGNAFVRLEDSLRNPIDKNSTFPSLNPDGKQGPLEGTLNFGPSLDIRTVAGNMGILPPFTLKFQVAIKDNAGHLSNEIVTDTVQIQYY
jgi:hypothetical protein